MDITTMVGVAAGIASTTSFAPQAWKIIKTKDVKSISTGMYILTVSGFTLWTTYGAMSDSWPLVLSNAICLALSAFILAMKLLPSKALTAVSKAVDPET